MLPEGRNVARRYNDDVWVRDAKWRFRSGGASPHVAPWHKFRTRLRR